jgi:hypothetical protein
LASSSSRRLSRSFSYKNKLNACGGNHETQLYLVIIIKYILDLCPERVFFALSLCGCPSFRDRFFDEALVLFGFFLIRLE